MLFVFLLPLMLVNKDYHYNKKTYRQTLAVMRRSGGSRDCLGDLARYMYFLHLFTFFS